MKSKSVYKVPNGKLLKINLDYDEKTQKIKNLKITGDFFAYPMESIEMIEKQLTKTPLEKNFLLEKIHSIMKKNHIQFIGLNAGALTNGILKCKK